MNAFGLRCLNMIIISALLMHASPLFSYTPYGELLCTQPDYTCRKITRGDSWGGLFPDAQQRDIVKRVNRTNQFLRPDMIIAIPKNLPQLTINDVSPFPQYIESSLEKTLYVDQQKLAWGAYDKQGKLVRWGPVSTGSNPCPDVPDGCLTPIGSFRIIQKQGPECISNSFPRRINGVNGGGDMPYCMRFFRGFFLHGSTDLAGYPDSHGCVRLFIEDAKWLNEVFVHVSDGRVKGTRVIILSSNAR